MTYIIPNQQTKQFRQLNKNDFSGELFVTKNIDLNDKGYLKLSHPSIAIMTTDDNADFDTVDAIFKSKRDLNVISKELFTNGSSKAVAIGDSFGGGIVAYILQSGDTGYDASKQKGLIISSSNISAGVYWHVSGTGTTGATGTAIGTGQSNTTAILALYGAESNAAKACDDYSSGGYSDWYLPSKDELHTAYTNRVAIGGLGSDVLWSSTEFSDSNAYADRMSDGFQGDLVKTSNQPVRAMRSFEITEITDNLVSLSQFTSRTDKGDTTPPTPGIKNDGVYFNTTEVISDGQYIYYRSSATGWTTINLSLNSLSPTSMCIFDTFNAVLVANVNKVHMIDTNWITVKTLTIPAQYEITSLDVNGNTCYIGTRHIANGEAKMFLWDGTSTASSVQYGVDTFEISSTKKYNGSVANITSKGKLNQYNGGGFSDLADLPTLDFDWGDSLESHSVISNRGMVVDKEQIYLRLDSLINGGKTRFNPYFIGGLWRFNPDNGLYHFASPSYTRVQIETITMANVNATTNIITVASSPITGTPCIYESNGGSAIGGLITDTVYYVIKISATEIKLATSLANALLGTAIDLTSTGNNAQKFNFFLVNDYGQSYAHNRGAVEILTNGITDQEFVDRVIFSGVVTSKTTTTKAVLNIMNPLLGNRGYFITPRLNSSNLEDLYGEVTLKYKPLKEEDAIILKYKKENRLNLPFGSFDNGGSIVGTWVDTNTFTTTLDMSNALIGDEIEIVGGVGAGCLFHIDSLSEDSGTWTINLTESFMFASANDIFYFYVDNWTYMSTITPSNQTGTDYFTFGLDDSSKFIQLKVEMRGIDITIEELKVDSSKFLEDR